MLFLLLSVSNAVTTTSMGDALLEQRHNFTWVTKTGVHILVCLVFSFLR